MRLFLDCEFSQLSASAKLISLALVAEDGREFYVELLYAYGQVIYPALQSQDMVCT